MTDYLEGALDEADRRRFERHLARCAACTAYLEQMRATVEVLGRLDLERLDPTVRDELMGIYRDYRAG